MNILIDKEILVLYLKTCLNKTKDKITADLIRVFENDDNILSLSKLSIEILEKELIDTPSLLYEFQAFISSINDDKRFLSQNVNEKTEEEEIIKIIENNKSIMTMFTVLNSSKLIFDKIKNQSCFWNDISKPNKDWLILGLVANRQVNVRYLDFSSDNQIKLFFNDYFNLNKINKEISVLDSYCNLHRHELFESIAKKGNDISVYTSSCNKTPFDINRMRKDIKAYLGNSTKVKFSSDKKLVHERTVISDNFILESNHDFAEIMRKNKNWKIDIIYDSQLKEENEEKFQSYKS